MARSPAGIESNFGAEKDLPFFINAMIHLSKKNFLCPKPIGDAKDNYLQELLGKPAIIVNYLQGKSKTKITIEDCYKVGSKMASMHIKTEDYSFKRKNSLSINGWQNLIKECYVTIPNEVSLTPRFCLFRSASIFHDPQIIRALFEFL